MLRSSRLLRKRALARASRKFASLARYSRNAFNFFVPGFSPFLRMCRVLISSGSLNGTSGLRALLARAAAWISGSAETTSLATHACSSAIRGLGSFTGGGGGAFLTFLGASASVLAVGGPGCSGAIGVDDGAVLINSNIEGVAEVRGASVFKIVSVVCG